MNSLVKVGKFSQNDIVLQISRCSYDGHVQDIVGSLIIGSTVVMITLKGHMDFEYLIHVLEEKQVTYMDLVPTLLRSFTSYLIDNTKGIGKLFLSTLVCGGKFLFLFTMKSPIWEWILKFPCDENRRLTAILFLYTFSFRTEQKIFKS